ncbi:hypothetical protein JCM11491_000839 [Sporobolomyces phaffii]
MSSSYQYHSQYTSKQDTYDPTTLQPLLSSLAGYALLLLVIYLATFGNSYRNVRELVQLAMNSILSGKAFSKANLDWTSPQDLDSLDATKGKGSSGIRRRYVDTQEGREAWESGNLHFPGLLNAAGNLCFLNATLQSMASLPSLIAYLDSLLTASESLSPSPPLPVTSALYTTLTALNTPSTSTRPPPLRPLLLATALADSSETRRRLLRSSEQQDAHELWGMIRDAVEEESIRLDRIVQRERQARAGSGLNEVFSLKRGGFEVGVEGLASGRGKGKNRDGQQNKRDNDPWFWLRSQRIKCMNCGYVRDTRHEGEELLMLNVPPVSSCSIYDLLQDYTKPDLLSDYACRKCAMLATLDKYKSQRDRLAGLIPTSTPAAMSNAFELPPGGEATTPSNGKDTKMTTSRKERKRKIGKLVDRIQTVVDAGDYEKPLEDDASGIKMERVGTAAGKSVNLARTPRLLLIHLNRSTQYGYAGPIKNSCQVTFPEYLDLAPFCDHPTPPTSSSKTDRHRDLYRLSSMVVHYGSHHFGHYVAFRRRPARPRRPDSTDAADSRGAGPEWYRISDETVDVSTIDEALRNNPFLLFYERLDDGPRSVVEVGAREDRRDEREGESDVGRDPPGLGGLFSDGLRPRVVESWRVRTVAKGDPGTTGNEGT